MYTDNRYSINYSNLYIMTILGIVGNTLYQFIQGARIEIESTVSDVSKADLIEYEGVKEYSSYLEMLEGYLSS